MIHKENEEIKYKYSIKGQAFNNHCQTFDSHYNDEYFYDKYPIAEKLQQKEYILPTDYSEGSGHGRK